MILQIDTEVNLYIDTNGWAVAVSGPSRLSVRLFHRPLLTVSPNRMEYPSDVQFRSVLKR